MVGDYVELAGGDQGLDGGGNELGVEQPAFMMAFLGPRVGEIDVQSLNALGSSVANDEILGIAAKHADIRQGPTTGAVGGVLVVFVGPFDAQVVYLGVGPGCVYEEGALTRANLDFDGVVVGKELVPVEAAFEAIDG